MSSTTLLLDFEYRVLMASDRETDFHFLLSSYDGLLTVEFPTTKFPMNFIPGLDGWMLSRSKNQISYVGPSSNAQQALLAVLHAKQSAIERLIFVINKWRARYLNSPYQNQNELASYQYAVASTYLRLREDYTDNPEHNKYNYNILQLKAKHEGFDMERAANMIVMEYHERMMYLEQTDILRLRFEKALKQATTLAEVQQVRADLDATTNYFI